MTPSSKLRWGVLGAGNIAGKFLAVFPQCKLARAVAIASRSQERAQQLAQRHGLARAYEGYEKILADLDVDIIYNALHTGLHAEWSIRALEAGKPVLCEKPLARNAAEAEAMFDAARRTGRFLMEGFMYRFHPQMANVRRLLDDGVIGRVKLIEAGYTNPRSHDDTPKWRKDWGGGAMMDLGCYTVDICRVIAGATPVDVTGRLIKHPQGEADETMTGILRFPDNCLGLIYASFGMARTHYCRIFGEKGQIEIPHPWRSEAVPLPVLVTRDGKQEQLEAPAANPFCLELDFFSECVALGTEPIYPARAVTAAQDSIENARVLELLSRTREV
jgi:predicted dehydrogenase